MAEGGVPFVVSIVGAPSFAAGSKTRLYKAQLVWPNGASKARIKELEKHDAQALKKAYGHDLLAEISPPGQSGRHSRTAKAGATDIAAVDEIVVTDDDAAMPEAVANGADVNGAVATIGGDDDDLDEFSLEAIDQALAPEEQSEKSPKKIAGPRERFVPERQLIFDRKVYVLNEILVLPDDNLSALKKKIQVASGIPTYRQHLWYESDFSVYSPCYAYYISDHLADVNIWDLRRIRSFISGIPVSNEPYIARGTIHVRNLEFSTRLGDIWQAQPDAKWFVADLNDWMGKSREQLAATIRHDMHIRNLIYYSFILRYWPAIISGVFQAFVENEPVLHDEYPEMSISTSLLFRQLSLEAKLIGNNPRPDTKRWPMDVYIREIDVWPIGEYYSYGSAVNLKNLFNYFKLEHDVPWMNARILINGRMHVLTKTLIGGRMPMHKHRIAMETVCIMVFIQDVGEMFLHVAADGTYHVKTEWREDMRLNAPDCIKLTIKHANPVIAKINSLGEKVIVRPLVMLSEHNADILGMAAVLIVRKKLNLGEFEGLKASLGKFQQAGMLHITSQEVNTITFHLFKGMYEYDDVRFDSISGATNGYEYATSITVSQRHQAVYLRQKTCIITNRAGDIHVAITGIRFGEMDAWLRYMLMLIQMPTTITSRGIERKTKTTTYFKEVDPLLYDLKKIYKHGVMYSQICQKPNQPMIVDKPGPKSVKYWNFTTNAPAYYECPDSKWPVLYFKTGIHPKDFCMPCCKKLELRAGLKHDDIFKRCQQDHVYVAASKNKTQSSYIIAYTPTITAGRISYLPEASLDQLFYQQHSTTERAIDPECIPRLGYYVFGISQGVGHAQDFGIASCLARALGMDPLAFISDTAARIKAQNADWTLILGGRIQSLFRTASDFAGALLMAVNSSSVDDADRITARKWNEIFVYVARIFWGINVILFIDSGDGQISIQMPENVHHIGEFISTRHSHLFVINSLQDAASPGTYLPIFLIDIDEYKKNGHINQTLFAAGDKVVGIIKNMLAMLMNPDSSRSARATEAVATIELIDLDLVLEWLDSADDLKLDHIYVNRRNVCYAIYMHSGNDGVYFPITGSLWDHLNVQRSPADFEYSGYKTSIQQTLEVMKRFNAWAESRAIDIATWILLGNNVIGFLDGRRKYYYYCSPIEPAQAQTIKNVPMMRVLYDPTAINRLIDRSQPNLAGPGLALTQCLYRHYGYNLFLLEFMSAMSRQLNQGVRSAITKIIRDKTPLTVINRGLKEILTDWPDDYDHLVSILAKFARSTRYGAAGHVPDYAAFIGHRQLKHDATSIMEIIANSRFSFDDVMFDELCQMEPAPLAAQLEPILGTMMEVTPGVVLENWPEHMTTCGVAKNDRSAGYCSGHKLRVSKKDYAVWKAQLVLDLKNTMKQKKLMLLAMRYILYDQATFVNVPDENIRVSIEA